MHVFLALVLWVAQDAEIDRLIRSLGSDEAKERESAERRLIELGARAREAVIRAAKDDNPEIAARAREVLRSTAFRMEELFDAGLKRETARAIPRFPQRLWSPEPAERASVLKELAEFQVPQNLAAVAKVLATEDLDDSVRIACLEIMEKLKSPELASLVLPLVKPRSSQHRSRVFEVLVATKAKASAPALLALLLDREVSRMAADTLEKLEVPIPERSIREMVRSSDAGVRSVGVGLINQQRLQGFTGELIAMLQQEGSESWPVYVALLRDLPPWNQLRPLVTAKGSDARLVGLRVAVAGRMPQAFDAALALLGDSDATVRSESMEVVVAWGGPESVRRLSEKGGPQALTALGRIGAPGAGDLAVQALKSEDPSLRQAAIVALRALDAHDLAALIVPRLDDSSPAVRAEAARVLPHLEGDAAGSRIAARLAKEEDPVVVARLLEAIAETGHAAAAPLVLRILREGKGEALRASVRAAGALRLQDAAPILVEGSVTGSREGMGDVYESLLQIRPDNLVALLRPLVKAPKKEEDDGPQAILKQLDRDKNRQNERALYLLYVDPPGASEFYVQCLKEGILGDYPVEMIRFLGAEEAIPWLVAQIEKSGGGQRLRGAGRFLASRGRRELLDKAMIWLRNGDPTVAAELLGGLEAEDRIPELAVLLDDSNPQVQGAALSALAQMGTSKAIEVLRKKISASKPMDRALTARWLVNIDRDGLIPEMEAVLLDDDPAVRVEAAYTLYLMNSKGSYDLLLKAYRRGIGKDDWVWPYAFASLGGARGREMLRTTFENTRDTDKRKALMGAMASGENFTDGEIAFVKRFVDDPELNTDAWHAFMVMAPDQATGLMADSRYRLAMCRGNWAISDLERAPLGGAVAALTSILRDREAGNRGQAASTLAKRGARQSVEPLARALHDEEQGVRRSAAIALCRLGDRRGVDELLKIQRHSTVAQGRMAEALFALNFVRNPDACKTLTALSWEGHGPATLTLNQALEELARRSGMKVTISKAVSAAGLRAPLDWPRGRFTLEEIALEGPWSRFAAPVIDSGEIRILAPDEAHRFWEEWARTR